MKQDNESLRWKGGGSQYTLSEREDMQQLLAENQNLRAENTLLKDQYQNQSLTQKWASEVFRDLE